MVVILSLPLLSSWAFVGLSNIEPDDAMSARALLLLSILPRSLAVNSTPSFVPSALALSAAQLSSSNRLLSSTYSSCAHRPFKFERSCPISATRASSTMKMATVSNGGHGDATVRTLTVHWFRQTDLRLHDNPALCRAVEMSLGKENRAPVGSSAPSSGGGGILPVFVFDTSRAYGAGARSELGRRKCGPRRAKFALQAVEDLRSNLEERGSGLVVGVGRTEEVLAGIARGAIAASGGARVRINVVCQEEVCSEELAVDKAVRSELAKVMNKGSSFRHETVWGSTMYDPESLPFDGSVMGIPDTFTPFRNKVEKSCRVGAPLDVPSESELRMPEDAPSIVKGARCHASLDYMPTLLDLRYSADDVELVSTVDPRSAMPSDYSGGETFALSRVKDYIWTKDLLKVYFDTRNGMIGSDYSTKFAPWLALGNVSPRYIARECRRYEETRTKNKSTYWVVFELLWRDYFKFFAKKHGDRIFHPSGTIGNRDHANKRKWGMDPKQVRAWSEGMTGYPLVDANMRELAATGFMSNRGRQNVASFLSIDMNMDWRHGADYFEETLLDYDVHSNWGNWCASAGMTGGRLNRFNIVKQSKDYDFGGDYVRLWCPELKDVPDKYVHEPWKMSEAIMEECGVKIGPGRDYPSPIVDPNSVPKIMGRGRGGGGRGGERWGRGSRGDRHGVERSGRGRADGCRDESNPNRGRGQRRDMKSLKTGSYRFQSKYV